MRTRRNLPPQVLLLGIISLLNDSASEMIYPLLPVFLTTTLGATPVIVGLIEGAADAVASILKLFAGAWSDRVRSRKPLIVGGYALAAGSRALIAAAGTWTTVLSARLIDRTGKGIRSAPRDAMIADVTPPEVRGRAFGFQRALDHAGAVIGPLIAIVLLRYFTLREMFLLAVVPGAIGVVLLLFFLVEDRQSCLSSKPEKGRRDRLPSTFWRAMTAIGLFSLANSSDAFLILQAHKAGVAISMLPLLWSAHHVVKALFSTHAGALSDRIGRRGLLAAAWTTYACIYLVFPSAQSLTFFFVLFVAYAIPFTLAEGAERALISDLVPADTRGKSFGVYYLVSGFGVLGGSALFGWLYQAFSASVAFSTGAALAFAAALVVSFRR